MSAIVLLSGGLDSAVCLAQAVGKDTRVLALTFNYGQKAAAREIRAAELLADHYGIEHEIIQLDFLRKLTKTALVNQDEEPPEPGLEDLDDISGKAAETARQVWVPNRNGLFINIAACYAEANGYEFIVAGFNREEAATFPDNSPEYIVAATAALGLSTLNKPQVLSYTIDLDKAGIVRLGRSLGLPFEYIWSCYHGGEQMCGRCESCRRFYRALERG